MSDYTYLDVGLYLKKDRFRCHPWQTFRAEILICAATGYGHRFATAVARLIMHALVKPIANDLWFLDQKMLYHV